MSAFDGKSLWEALGIARDWLDLGLELPPEDHARARAFLRFPLAAESGPTPPPPAPIEYEARDERIVSMRREGFTLSVVGHVFGISGVRVRQIMARQERRERRIAELGAKAAALEARAKLPAAHLWVWYPPADDTEWMIVDTPEAMYERGRHGEAD